MTLVLTPDELIELTHRRRPAAQARALRQMGIDFLQRVDGTLAVFRDSLHAGVANAKLARDAQINWSS